MSKQPKKPYSSPAEQEAAQKAPLKQASWVQRMFDTSVVTRALIMAAIVGTVLVGINHGPCIIEGHFNLTCFWQSALTYTIPYTVSTISSILAMAK